MDSLNTEYEGFKLDDFMRTLAAIAAWNKEGKPVNEFVKNNQMLARSE